MVLLKKSTTRPQKLPLMLEDKKKKRRNIMEKEITKEVLSSTILEEELARGRKYGSGYRSAVSHTFNHCGRWDLNPHMHG